MLKKNERRQLVPVQGSSADENDDEYDSDTIPQKLTQINKGFQSITAKQILCIGLTFITVIMLGISCIGLTFIHTSMHMSLIDKYTDYILNNAAIPVNGINAENNVYGADESKTASLKVEGALEVRPMELLQKTVTPILPGIYHMNKIYNLFVGRPVYELYGIDVIDFSFDGVETMINDASYEVPLELRSIPNVDPSCDVESTVNSVYYSSSSSVLDEQAKGLSGGYEAEYDWTGSVEADGVSAGVGTSTRNAAMFGHSSTSKDGRSKAAEDYSWAFSLEAKTKLYKAEIDWSLEETFKWKDSFIKSLEELDVNRFPTNKSIMQFIHKWGTHVLQTAQTGSYCRETAHVESSAQQSDVQQFRSDVDAQSFGYGFWSADRSKSSSELKSGETESKHQYEFSDIYCVGEVEMTASSCSAQTAEQNNPVVISYIPVPVWKITDVKKTLTKATLEMFSYFIFLLLDSLERCGIQMCRGAGTCTLDEEIWSEEWIANWDGIDFDAMWNAVDNEYCFCEDGKESADCDSCLCFGDENCCCYDGRDNTMNNTCAADLLCTAENKCIAQNPNTVECGYRGDLLQCTGGSGFVFKVCASGQDPDCHRTKYCSSDDSSGMQCGYEELGTWGADPQWKCALTTDDDVAVSCLGEDAGEILGGICSSGEDADCTEPCEGHTAALCVSIEGVDIDAETCEWYEQSQNGYFIECPDGEIATGFCSSGKLMDCGAKDQSHGIQCCKLSY